MDLEFSFICVKLFIFVLRDGTLMSDEPRNRSASPKRFYKSARSDRFISLLDRTNEFPTPLRTPKKRKLIFTEESPISHSQREMRDLKRNLETPTKSDPFPLAPHNHAIPTPKTPRKIQTNPYMVLGIYRLKKDAPGARDDYYTNVLDWAASGLIVVGLDNNVYTYQPRSGVNFLFQTPKPDFISSCQFSPDASTCAVTTLSADILLLEPDSGQEISRKTCNEGVCSFKWTDDNTFCTGDSQGNIKWYDTRTSKEHGSFSSENFINYHRDQIVGFAASPENHQIASGCNGHV